MASQSKMIFRTGAYLGVPIEQVPTEYLERIAAKDSELHVMWIEFDEHAWAAVKSELEERAAAGAAVEEVTVPTETLGGPPAEGDAAADKPVEPVVEPATEPPSVPDVNV